MALNGAVLARARENLAARREANRAEQERRVESVYARFPRVREIDAALRSQMARLCVLALSREPGTAERVAALKSENLRLQRERALILRSAGLQADFTDEIYSCGKCRDTGYVGSEMCECLRREYNACLTRELSGMLSGDGASFAAFRLDYYSDGRDPKSGSSPRDAMRMVFDYCRLYAERFSPDSPNLLFRGGTGLGKTFLSECIAREVAKKGYSVAYESAPTALGMFEAQRFAREGERAEAADAKVREYLGCDLMILDDLGAEGSTSFTVAALYQLINTRLIAGKQTIVSTNLTADEIERRYGKQTASRLAREFEDMNFAGSDIRRLRKERGE